MNSNIVDFLNAHGLVSQADLVEARALQAHGGGSVAAALIRLGVIGDERLAEAVAGAMALPLLADAPDIGQILAAQQSLRFSLNWLAEQEVLIWHDALDRLGQGRRQERGGILDEHLPETAAAAGAGQSHGLACG